MAVRGRSRPASTYRASSNQVLGTNTAATARNVSSPPTYSYATPGAPATPAETAAIQSGQTVTAGQSSAASTYAAVSSGGETEGTTGARTFISPSGRVTTIGATADPGASFGGSQRQQALRAARDENQVAMQISAARQSAMRQAERGGGDMQSIFARTLAQRGYQQEQVAASLGRAPSRQTQMISSYAAAQQAEVRTRFPTQADQGNIETLPSGRQFLMGMAPAREFMQTGQLRQPLLTPLDNPFMGPTTEAISTEPTRSREVGPGPENLQGGIVTAGLESYAGYKRGRSKSINLDKRPKEQLEKLGDSYGAATFTTGKSDPMRAVREHERSKMLDALTIIPAAAAEGPARRIRYGEPFTMPNSDELAAPFKSSSLGVRRGRSDSISSTQDKVVSVKSTYSSDNHYSPKDKTKNPEYSIPKSYLNQSRSILPGITSQKLDASQTLSPSSKSFSTYTTDTYKVPTAYKPTAYLSKKSDIFASKSEIASIYGETLKPLAFGAAAFGLGAASVVTGSVAGVYTFARHPIATTKSIAGGVTTFVKNPVQKIDEFGAEVGGSIQRNPVGFLGKATGNVALFYVTPKVVGAPVRAAYQEAKFQVLVSGTSTEERTLLRTIKQAGQAVKPGATPTIQRPYEVKNIAGLTEGATKAEVSARQAALERVAQKNPDLTLIGTGTALGQQPFGTIRRVINRKIFYDVSEDIDAFATSPKKVIGDIKAEQPYSKFRQVEGKTLLQNPRGGKAFDLHKYADDVAADQSRPLGSVVPSPFTGRMGDLRRINPGGKIYQLEHSQHVQSKLTAIGEVRKVKDATTGKTIKVIGPDAKHFKHVLDAPSGLRQAAVDIRASTQGKNTISRYFGERRAATAERAATKIERSKLYASAEQSFLNELKQGSRAPRLNIMSAPSRLSQSLSSAGRAASHIPSLGSVYTPGRLTIRGSSSFAQDRSISRVSPSYTSRASAVSSFTPSAISLTSSVVSDSSYYSDFGYGGSSYTPGGSGSGRGSGGSSYTPGGSGSGRGSGGSSYYYDPNMPPPPPLFPIPDLNGGGLDGFGRTTKRGAKRRSRARPSLYGLSLSDLRPDIKFKSDITGGIGLRGFRPDFAPRRRRTKRRR